MLSKDQVKSIVEPGRSFWCHLRFCHIHQCPCLLHRLCAHRDSTKEEITKSFPGSLKELSTFEIAFDLGSKTFQEATGILSFNSAPQHFCDSVTELGSRSSLLENQSWCVTRFSLVFSFDPWAFEKGAT